MKKSFLRCSLSILSSSFFCSFSYSWSGIIFRKTFEVFSRSIFRVSFTKKSGSEFNSDFNRSTSFIVWRDSFGSAPWRRAEWSPKVKWRPNWVDWCLVVNSYWWIRASILSCGNPKELRNRCYVIRNNEPSLQAFSIPSMTNLWILSKSEIFASFFGVEINPFSI